MSWHAIQSAHNRNAQRYLSRESQLYRDWEITTLFYATMHAIDGYLSSKIGRTPRNHTERDRLVAKELRDVYQDYHTFYALCRRARYVAVFYRITEDERQTAMRLHDSICGYVRIHT